jgi:hypothetical protein
MSDDTHGIRLRFETMQKLVAQIDAAILDQKTKDYFLELPKRWLSDADHFIQEGRAGAASLVLGIVEQQLLKVSKSVAEFSPNIQLTG